MNLYGVHRWGCGFFGVADSGNVFVDAPLESGSRRIELTDVVAELKSIGFEMPIVLRLENLITARVTQLNQAFRNAIESTNYKGDYQGVFPIKVNQQNHVIEHLVRCGDEFAFGLEAGSKPELLIAMASLRNKESPLICNGYKDREFIDLGLNAVRLGFRCFFVIENLHELDLILERSKTLGIEPLLGARIKLSTKVEGNWQNDSGDRSLFGLTTIQLITLVDKLKHVNKLHLLEMLHFHLGSQIPNIRNIRDGVNEACRYFIDMTKEGANLKYLDLGGGLAVDYDGSASTNQNSRNYDINEYCIDVVEAIDNALTPLGIPHPTIITESGRWLIAPMSILLFDILAVEEFAANQKIKSESGNSGIDNWCEPVLCLFDTESNFDQHRLQENYNDTIYNLDQSRRQFSSGKISLREKAIAENTSLRILNRIVNLVPSLPYPSPELLDLKDKLADIYYGNFSVFQSLPDAWAIEQIFPVMPIHRLSEMPTKNGVIADLTCDCDGKLDRFFVDSASSGSLPLHELRSGEDYLLGVFLVGAYQETLGDLHNLFGDTNVASVRITGDREFEFLELINGDNVADLLSYVEYQPKLLLEQFREMTMASFNDGRISLDEAENTVAVYSAALKSISYLTSS
jgi:arginine decarboxylase